MPVRQQSQVRRGELKAGLPRSTISTSRGIEFLEGAGPEVLAPDNQTVSLPQEDLDVIAVAIDKQEEVTQEWILAKVLARIPKRPSKLVAMSVGGVQRKTRTAVGS